MQRLLLIAIFDQWSAIAQMGREVMQHLVIVALMNLLQ
jgi:hypothetical protein